MKAAGFGHRELLRRPLRLQEEREVAALTQLAVPDYDYSNVLSRPRAIDLSFATVILPDDPKWTSIYTADVSECPPHLQMLTPHSPHRRDDVFSAFLGGWGCFGDASAK